MMTQKRRVIAALSLSKNPRVDKGLQPLMFNPALTTCASERMKTQRFSYFADFAARERMREAKPVKLKKVAFSHFFDTLKGTALSVPFILSKNPMVDKGPQPLINPALTAQVLNKKIAKAAPPLLRNS